MSVAFGSSCLGSNPRGQVVVVVGTGHHASVVFWQVFKTHALVVSLNVVVTTL